MHALIQSLVVDCAARLYTLALMANCKIKYVFLSGYSLALLTTDGRVTYTPLTQLPTLRAAKPSLRKQWVLCGAGTGIRWPELDYELSAEGLLRGEAAHPVKTPSQVTRLTPAQQRTLDELLDGSVLRVDWFGSRGSITKPNGMTVRINRRIAVALVNSGVLTRLEYDGRQRDSYRLRLD